MAAAAIARVTPTAQNEFRTVSAVAFSAFGRHGDTGVRAIVATSGEAVRIPKIGVIVLRQLCSAGSAAHIGT